jgi:hypothetical protein
MDIPKLIIKKDSGRRLTPATISGGSEFPDFLLTAKTESYTFIKSPIYISIS